MSEKSQNQTSSVEKTADSNPKKKNGHRRIILLIIFILVLAAGLFWGGKWLYYRLTHAVTDDAFISSDIIDVAPLVSGHIEKVLVNESQDVKKGQLLATIDPKDYKVAVAIRRAGFEEALSKKFKAQVAVKKAETALTLTRNEVRTAISTARANLNAVRARFNLAKKNFLRMSALIKQGAIARTRYDSQKTVYEQEKEALIAARAALTRALSMKGRIALAKKEVLFTQKVLKVAEAAVKVNAKKLERAKISLGHTLVKSPINGVIAKRFIDPGDFVAAGQPMFGIYNPKDIYIMANLEETKLKGVEIGCPVDVWVDAYPGMKFRGKVVRITPAAAAKFALIPRDVTAGEFTKVVQRLPVKIELENIPKGIKLAPGMSVEIGILKRHGKKTW